MTSHSNLLRSWAPGVLSHALPDPIWDEILGYANTLRDVGAARMESMMTRPGLFGNLLDAKTIREMFERGDIRIDHIRATGWTSQPSDTPWPSSRICPDVLVRELGEDQNGVEVFKVLIRAGLKVSDLMDGEWWHRIATAYGHQSWKLQSELCDLNFIEPGSAQAMVEEMLKKSYHVAIETEPWWDQVETLEDDEHAGLKRRPDFRIYRGLVGAIGIAAIHGLDFFAALADATKKHGSTGWLISRITNLVDCARRRPDLQALRSAAGPPAASDS